MKTCSMFHGVCVLSATLVGALLTMGSFAVVPVRAQTAVMDMDEIIRQMAPPPRKRGIGVQPARKSEAKPSSAGKPVVFSAIQFELNSARFTDTARRQVQELGKALKSKYLAPFTFTLAGHTDSSGGQAYNRDLSLRRARAVKTYLMDAMGVSEARLIEVGFGEDYPMKDIPSDDARNRRVEVANRGVLPPRSAAGSPTTDPRARRALIIGIDHYQHVSRLKGPVSDASAMAKFVRTTMGFRDADVRTLLNGEATRAGIIGAIENWLIKDTRPGDEVFLYFSGHGFQREDQNGDEPDKLDETLVPVDAYVDKHNMVQNMISDDEVAALLERLSGRRVWVVVDACHSGTSTRALGDSARYRKTPTMPDGSPLKVVATTTPGVKVTKTPTTGRDRAPAPFVSTQAGNLEVWSAVDAHQVALVDREAQGQGGSVFTRRLLWGARDNRADTNEDGRVTVRELSDYVTKESRAYCTKYADDCPKGLVPQVHADSARQDQRAFAAAPAALTRTATFAKDVLVRASEERAAATDTAKLQLKLHPGTRLALDTKLEVTVTSQRGGNLVVLDMDAAGNLTQIFPNELSQRAGVKSRIEPQQTISLPGVNAGFEFRAVPPAGKSLLLAIVHETNKQLGAVTARHKDLTPVATSEAYVLELEQALRRTDGAPGVRGWELATLEYEIVPSLPETSR